MDYMTRFLIGAAQLVCHDKAEAADAKRVEASTHPDRWPDDVARFAAIAEWRGRHEAWLEASQLIERVCAQADRVPF